jgi:hypothetical protein
MAPIVAARARVIIDNDFSGDLDARSRRRLVT